MAKGDKPQSELSAKGSSVRGDVPGFTSRKDGTSGFTDGKKPDTAQHPMAPESQKGQAGGGRKGVESLAQKLKRSRLTAVLNCRSTLQCYKADGSCHCRAPEVLRSNQPAAAQALAQLTQLTHTDWKFASRLGSMQLSRWRMTAHWR